MGPGASNQRMARIRLFSALLLLMAARLCDCAAATGHTFGLYQSNDSGSTWKEVSHPFKNLRVNALHAESDRVWAGTDRGLFASRDAGKTWRDLAQPRLGNIQSIAATRDVMILATKSGLWRAQKGNDWSQAAEFNGRIMRAAATDGTNFFAGSDYGEAFASSDAGVTWRNISQGLPDKSQIFELKTGLNGQLFTALYSKGFYTYTDGIWQNLGAPFAFTMLPIDNNTLIVGGNPGGVMRSDDAGKTWSNAGGLSSLAPTWMLFKNNQTLFVGSTGRSGLFRSNDLGKNWTPIAEKDFSNKAVVTMTAAGKVLLVATVNAPTPEWMDIGKIAGIAD